MMPYFDLSTTISDYANKYMYFFLDVNFHIRNHVVNLAIILES